MKKFNPEMKVVRFGNEDVIATSGVNIDASLSGFGDKVSGNGVFNIGGTDYITGNYTTRSSVQTLLRDNGFNVNAGIKTGSYTTSVANLFSSENGSTGANGTWNGDYVYDANATWSATSGTFKGVFIKQ